jgi:hypothetical protein
MARHFEKLEMTAGGASTSTNTSIGAGSHRRGPISSCILAARLIALVLGFFSGAGLCGNMAPTMSITFQSATASSKKLATPPELTRLPKVLCGPQDKYDDSCIGTLNGIDHDLIAIAPFDGSMKWNNKSLLLNELFDVSAKVRRDTLGDISRHLETVPCFYVVPI